MKDLKITVITVCYNAVGFIEDTILSVVNQTYDNIEYIIIDGGSTDGTVDLIRKYDDKIDCWVSEPDKGIYDAMNKGIKIATGDFINFMNAGDTFFSNAVISCLVPQIERDSTIVYGDTMYVYSQGEKFIKPLSSDNMLKRMFFNHQSSFSKSQTLKSMLFDTSYKLSADYKYHYDVFKMGGKFQYVPLVIARYDAQNGVSAKHISLMYWEYGRVQGKVDSLKWKVSYLFRISLYNIKKTVKYFVPVKFLMLKNGIK